MLSSNTSAVSGDTVYVEDVFSTYLYNGASNTALQIQNGIDLSTKGGMVWIKCRSNAVNHALFDTSRGVASSIQSNSTNAAAATPKLGTFNTDGFTHSATPTNANLDINETSRTFASWTFRKQPKFFDVVTYTGDGSASRAINHNLGSVPGCIIVKCTSTATNWPVYHRGLNGGVNPEQYAAYLNLTNDGTGGGRWANTAPTSTQFYVNNDGTVNTNGATYVAYIFAHNAGGFGLTGTDNVISCGSAVTNGSGSLAVTLGYEPQWVMVKNTTSAGGWYMVDTMRGFVASPGTTSSYLAANISNAEASWGAVVEPTATGFNIASGLGGASQTIIYIAIRRGPMKVPTDATKVFAVNKSSSSTTPLTITTNFPVDLSMQRYSSAVANTTVLDRLRGGSQTSYARLLTNSTGAEVTGTGVGIGFDSNTTIVDNGWLAGTADTKVYWDFQRASSFFDEVCYTGTGTQGQNIPHSLGVAPELQIIKKRSAADSWYIRASSQATWKYLNFSTQAEQGTNNTVFPSNSTSTNIVLGNDGGVNASGGTYVAYLFATCAGVSKVGSYTGTGTTKQVDCGFAAGARFVLIKRTDSTGDWYVWDTARGIVSGNDPYLLLNSTAAEDTSTDYIDTYSAGFELSSTAPAALNASGGTYIFLAIA